MHSHVFSISTRLQLVVVRRQLQLRTRFRRWYRCGGSSVGAPHLLQDVVVEDAVVSLEHLSHEVVDGAAAFELVLPAFVLDQLSDEFTLHLLNSARYFVLIVLPVRIRLVLPPHLKLALLPYAPLQVAVDVVGDCGCPIDLHRPVPGRLHLPLALLPTPLRLPPLLQTPQHHFQSRRFSLHPHQCNFGPVAQQDGHSRAVGVVASHVLHVHFNGLKNAEWRFGNSGQGVLVGRRLLRQSFLVQLALDGGEVHCVVPAPADVEDRVEGQREEPHQLLQFGQTAPAPDGPDHVAGLVQLPPLPRQTLPRAATILAVLLGLALPKGVLVEDEVGGDGHPGQTLEGGVAIPEDEFHLVAPLEEEFLVGVSRVQFDSPVLFMGEAGGEVGVGAVDEVVDLALSNRHHAEGAGLEQGDGFGGVAQEEVGLHQFGSRLRSFAEGQLHLCGTFPRGLHQVINRGNKIMPAFEQTNRPCFGPSPRLCRHSTPAGFGTCKFESKIDYLSLWNNILLILIHDCAVRQHFQSSTPIIFHFLQIYPQYSSPALPSPLRAETRAESPPVS